MIQKKRKAVVVAGSYGDWEGWDPQSRCSVWPWSVEKSPLLKAEGKGEEEGDRFNKACKYDKMEEAQVFLLDGLHFPNEVRGTIGRIKEQWSF